MFTPSLQKPLPCPASHQIMALLFSLGPNPITQFMASLFLAMTLSNLPRSPTRVMSCLHPPT
ncbi:hypothetical protein Lalb_Chr12g0201161 [Lupinus albus]|uniref:Uncharacterized protein n=1 Tax=Lupinus albus TaxID=3870 RepID=A0A6A4PMC8_LUPAL|nr:hypothetical protein Lalb_Chr12g0201161 [Lupinus albus]